MDIKIMGIGYKQKMMLQLMTITFCPGQKISPRYTLLGDVFPRVSKPLLLQRVCFKTHCKFEKLNNNQNEFLVTIITEGRIRRSDNIMHCMFLCAALCFIHRRRHKESISHIPTETYYPKKRTYADHSPRPGSPNSAGSVLSQGSDTDSARHNRSRNGTPKPHKSKN